MGLPDYLRRELGRRQTRNAAYSVRAFARDLGVDHSTLLQWMRRTRPISEESAASIFDALKLRGRDRDLAAEMDEPALNVLAAIRQYSLADTASLERQTGLTSDAVKLILFKLLRLSLLRMDGAIWRVEPMEVL